MRMRLPRGDGSMWKELWYNDREALVSKGWGGVLTLEIYMFFLHEPRKNPGKRAPGCLLYIGDEILPNYMGIMINHYKDLY